SLATLLTDPQLGATGFWKIVEHPSEGTLRLPDVPPRFSKTPPEIRRLPPRLGEHSVEVLREAGLSQSEIDTMLASGAAAGPRRSDATVAGRHRKTRDEPPRRHRCRKPRGRARRARRATRRGGATGGQGLPPRRPRQHPRHVGPPPFPDLSRRIAGARIRAG